MKSVKSTLRILLTAVTCDTVTFMQLASHCASFCYIYRFRCRSIITQQHINIIAAGEARSWVKSRCAVGVSAIVIQSMSINQSVSLPIDRSIKTHAFNIPFCSSVQRSLRWFQCCSVVRTRFFHIRNLQDKSMRTYFTHLSLLSCSLVTCSFIYDTKCHW